MGKLIAIFFSIFFTAAAVTGASYPSTVPLLPPANKETPNHSDSSLPAGPLSEMPADDNEEETDDKDETSKDKEPQRITTLNLSVHLEQLYARQQLVFNEHQPEVATPPPRF